MDLVNSYKIAQDELVKIFNEQYHGCQGDINSLKKWFYNQGVLLKVSEDKKRFKFKYRQVFCKFNKPWQLACRGTIFYKIGESGWQTFFAANKFFNYGEMKQHIKCTLEDFIKAQIDGHGQLSYAFKHDGSNIQAYLDSDGQLKLMTLGALDPTVMSSKTEHTFETCALSILQRDNLMELLMSELKNGCSMVFELCSQWNKIVSVYSQEHLIPLYKIDEHGFPVALDPNKWSGYMNVAVTGTELQIKKELFKNHSHDLVTESPEGIVVYWNAKYNRVDTRIPMCKLKSEEYLAATRNVKIRSNPLAVNGLIEIAVCKGTNDDICETDEEKAYAEKFVKFIEEVCNELGPLIPTLIANQNNGKEYSKVVKSFKWTALQPFVYSIKKMGYTDAIDCDVYQLFTAWLITGTPKIVLEIFQKQSTVESSWFTKL